VRASHAHFDEQQGGLLFILLKLMAGIIFFKSVLSYFNADTDKESALNDNKGKTGIYL
jgi:hypothetical protein